MRTSRIAWVGALLALAAPVGACGTDPRDAFLGGVASPTPAQTIAPQAGSWSAAPVSAGTTIEVVAFDSGRSEVIVAAVQSWARDVGARVSTRTATDAESLDAALSAAIADGPTLVVGAGAGVVDEFTQVTGQWLDQEFLVVGAQLAEPTENVTAVIWQGAAYRGAGITPDGDDDPDAVTTDRAVDAVSAGWTAIDLGLTGLVVALP